MPNIEIFGATKKLRIRIIDTVTTSLYEIGGDIVFTIHKVKVKDICGNDAPYVRITDTDIFRAEEIAVILHEIVDVEISIIDGFIARSIETL